MSSAADDLLAKAGKTKFKSVLADPPWQFQNLHHAVGHDPTWPAMVPA